MDVPRGTIIAVPVADSIQRVKAYLDGFRNGFPMAMQRAISRTLTHAVSRKNPNSPAKKIAREVNLKEGVIRKAISVKRPSYKNLVGYLTVARERLFWLSEYLPQATLARLAFRSLSGRGAFARMKGTARASALSVLVRKRVVLAKYPTEIKKGFVSAMGKGLRYGVFQRTGVKRVMKSGKHAGKVREAIHRMGGPSPLTIFEKAKGEGAATIMLSEIEDLNAWLLKELISQLNAAIEGKAGYVPLES
jgi:hypothetical protein